MACLNSMRTGMRCEIALFGKLWVVAGSAGGPEHVYNPEGRPAVLEDQALHLKFITSPYLQPELILYLVFTGALKFNI